MLPKAGSIPHCCLKQRVLTDVIDVRFWHKADVVQANVRYEQKADVTGSGKRRHQAEHL